MRSRASTMRRLFAVLLVVGVIGSIIVGIEAGRSVSFNTAVFFTTSSSSNTARGVTVFLVGLALTVMTTLPLLGISWLIDGQAALLEETP